MRDVICLMGPTGSGKTELATQLIEKLPCEIISVDSAMVYRGLDIGSAKPNQSELAQTPHFLIDIREPTNPYSVADFCDDASKLCESILARGNVPLLVGGTMMYFRALQEGLSALPKAHQKIRERLAKRLKEEGLAALYERLKAVDPITAKRLHPNDSQRIQRALEVYDAKGEALSTIHEVSSSKPHDFCWINLALFPNDRSWLHSRIEKRFDVMLALGFLDEVKNLLDLYGEAGIDTPAMKSVGYRQAIKHIQGEDDFETFRMKAIAATRQLAKRQLTWLRTWPNVYYFDPSTSDCFQPTLELILKTLDNQQSKIEGL